MKRLFSLFLILIISMGAIAQDKVLTLDECVGVAMEQNPQLIMSEFQMKMAGKDVWVSVASLLPNASANLGYTHQVSGALSAKYIDQTTGILVPLRDKESSYYSSSRITVSQELSVQNVYGLKQSLALKKSAVYSFAGTKQNIIYLVKERYYNLLKSEKMLDVAEETGKSSQESLKRANALYEVGKVPKSDVLTAKVQAERDKLGVIRAENSLSIARASLNHVLGFEVDNEIRVKDNLNVPEVEVGYADAMGNALGAHPSLMQAQSNLAAANAGMGVAIGRWLPSVSAFFQHNWNNKDFNKIDNLFDTDYRWYMGAQLSIPLLQGGARVAQTAKARLAKKSSRKALMQAKRDIELEVKQSYFEVEQFKREIAVSRNAEEAAEEGLRLNQERYSLGAGTMLDLLNAQVQSRQAKSDFIQALYSYKYAIARLERAMGQLNR
ncbi:TolC family protein [bacterium]|nr:TolC family protein [bacterium]